MKREEKSILDRATHALQADVPNTEAITASAGKAAQRLGIQMNHEVFSGAIRNCDDVRQLLDSYRAGSLSEARTLLVQAHLGECGLCLRHFREGGVEAAVDWAQPRVASRERVRSTPQRHPHAWGWALALSCALLTTAIFVYKAYWQVPPGVRAEVQSIDGSAYLISGPGNARLAPGTKLLEGDRMRTAGNSRAVLRLSDGSVVEMNQRSTLDVSARGRNTTIELDEGALIVTAAHRTSGHLYVNTPDCRLAVTGTLFSVNSGIKGSRVAVLQGSVDVAHTGVHALLHPGEQMATSDNLAPEPLNQEFAWSADREEYIGLIAQLANVQQLIAQIPFPQSRYSSDLLPRMPDNTLLYISIPNLGDYLSQANAIFQDQLSQSPELQQWWARGQKGNTQDLNSLVEKIHDVSQFLGDEVVIAAVGQGNQPGIAVLAQVQRSGLDAELRQQFTTTTGGLVVLDEASLSGAGATTAVHRGYALVREHEVVFSNSIATLKQFNAQLDAGASGFAAGDFGKQIAAAYQRGAGIILAADLHTMLQNRMNRGTQSAAGERILENSGVGALQYLIAEHREANGIPQNHLNLQFSGTRQRVASWLASPAPIGSLDFVSPNAAIAVAALSKDPAAIADDIMEMASQSKGSNASWSEIDSKLQISVRDDLMANLGGDFLIALDGPVLPTPSWKLVIEVNDPDRLENTLERIVQAVNNQTRGSTAHTIAIKASTAGAQRYYAIQDVTTGNLVANYTFDDGFMIVAPQRAQLMDALQIHASGNSLGQSAVFRALLPRDENENYSAVAYQNLGPVLTPLLSQLNGDSANAIRKLAADSRPTVACAWGKDSRIEAASDSRLFGFDFLTLGAVLDSRNKMTGQTVVK
jgi:ferric-dicitrate binding protein FerR (iron transport regulator)